MIQRQSSYLLQYSQVDSTEHGVELDHQKGDLQGDEEIRDNDVEIQILIGK